MEVNNESMVIEGQNCIKLYRLKTLRQALKLEMAGMKRRGQSACTIIKGMLGLPASTTKEKTLAALDAHMKEIEDSFDET